MSSKILSKLGLLNVRNVSYQQILNNLMDSSHNINLKTRIPKPENLAILHSLGGIYAGSKLRESAGLVNGFIDIVKEYWISKNGEGRKEVVKALSYLIEDEKRLTTSDKMSTNLRKL